MIDFTVATFKNAENGSILVSSISIQELAELMLQYVPLDVLPKHYTQEQVEKVRMTVDSLPLSVRARNAIRGAGIKTIDDLLKCSPMTLRQCRNCGLKTIHEIAKIVRANKWDFQSSEWSWHRYTD